MNDAMTSSIVSFGRGVRNMSADIGRKTPYAESAHCLFVKGVEDVKRVDPAEVTSACPRDFQLHVREPCGLEFALKRLRITVIVMNSEPASSNTPWRELAGDPQKEAERQQPCGYSE